MKRAGYLCIAVVFLLATNAYGQLSVGENGTLKGLAYTDYYWFAQSHNESFEGQNGFWFRRIYLTYEHDLGDSFSSRVRLEMSNPGDLSSGGKMSAVVKDAYLKWSNDQHQILAGISGSPTFGLTEDIWGYRAIEKAPQDLFGFGSSRDFGIAFKGALGNEERWNYHFFVGNGNSNGTEINKGKKVMGALGYYITDNWVVQGYFDYNSTGEEPGARDHYTLQGLTGYESDEFNVGVLYARQHLEALLGAGPTELDLVSVFANAKLNNKLQGFIRADHLLDPYAEGPSNSYLPMSDQGKPLFLVGGIDINLAEQVHLIPNIESVLYRVDEQGNSPDADIVPRLTLFYSF